MTVLHIKVEWIDVENPYMHSRIERSVPGSWVTELDFKVKEWYDIPIEDRGGERGFL
jgi:hypothetical protein